MVFTLLLFVGVMDVKAQWLWHVEDEVVSDPTLTNIMSWGYYNELFTANVVEYPPNSYDIRGLSLYVYGKYFNDPTEYWLATDEFNLPPDACDIYHDPAWLQYDQLVVYAAVEYSHPNYTVYGTVWVTTTYEQN